MFQPQFTTADAGGSVVAKRASQSKLAARSRRDARRQRKHARNMAMRKAALDRAAAGDGQDGGDGGGGVDAEDSGDDGGSDVDATDEAGGNDEADGGDEDTGATDSTAASTQAAGDRAVSDIVAGKGFVDNWPPEASLRPHNTLCTDRAATVLWDHPHLHCHTLGGVLNTRRGARVMTSKLVNLTCLAYSPDALEQLHAIIGAKQSRRSSP